MVFTRSSSHFDEGIEEFKSYMANEHSLKQPQLIIIKKKEKSTGYDQSYTFKL